MIKKTKKALITGAVILAALIVFIHSSNNRIQVCRYHLQTENLPESFQGFKIVHIGDLHGKEFGINNHKLALIIEKQKPDIILATGDMINSGGDGGGAFIGLLRELNGICPIYCSLGNHEQILYNRDQSGGRKILDLFWEQIREAGGTLLDNQQVDLYLGGGSITIYGFTSALYHYTGRDSARWEGADLKVDFIEEKLGSPEQDRFTILLAHNPKYFAEYAAWGADVIFSGHVHGGVIRLPFLGGLFSPDITLFPEYHAGMYSLGEVKMHVTRGLGNSVIPVRFLNRPEVAVIELNVAP